MLFRSRASTGTSTSRENCHPFRFENALFMHNGQIGGYERIRREIENLIPRDAYRHRHGTTDSEAFFLLAIGNGLLEDPPAALARTDGPTLLALTRQALPTLNEIPLQTRREGVLRGGYVALRETAPLTRILIATGSELQLALGAAKTLGAGVRVVSMPSTQIFDRQSADYRESVLPSSCRRRVAVEAGVTVGWYKYVGLDGRVVGIDRFGLSAPAPVVFKELGLTVEAVVAAAQAL